MSQMDIKRKTCDIRSWKKHSFLDISSTNNDTFVLSLYQCFETRSIEIIWLLSQPLPHLLLDLFFISETFTTKKAISRPNFELLYATNISHRKQETSLYRISFALSPFAHEKKMQNRTLLTHSSSKVVIFTTETSLWTCACASAT
jgi:hypothetical protein